MCRIILLSTLIALVIVSCAEEALPQAEAEKYVRDTVAKMPAPGVSVYLGAMTDEGYVPTYRAIAADKKYLVFEESVFIKEANRSMPRITLTDEGKKLFVCEKNRCAAPVCALSVAKVDPPVKVGKEWHVTYTTETKCEGTAYTSLKALADRQFIKPETQQGKIILSKNPTGYDVRLP